jgi:hypothetical protein
MQSFEVLESQVQTRPFMVQKAASQTHMPLHPSEQIRRKADGVIGISVHYLPRCTKGDSDNLAQKMDA